DFYAVGVLALDAVVGVDVGHFLFSPQAAAALPLHGWGRQVRERCLLARLLASSIPNRARF
ncbi:hypothetical protein ACIGJK_20675, partial [Pseudomonas iridis]|uniref:hypothetical protein n=1 Tax=Pseudomonas iridis TaxID=2710587 RepID=UPI0037C54D28